MKIVVINIFRDEYDLDRKFEIDLGLFRSCADLSTSLSFDRNVIYVNGHENHYIILNKVNHQKIKEMHPSSINVYEITPTLDNIRKFHLSVLPQEGTFSIISKIK